VGAFVENGQAIVHAGCIAGLDQLCTVLLIFSESFKDFVLLQFLFIEYAFSVIAFHARTHFLEFGSFLE
jgi:hypothetical protein